MRFTRFSSSRTLPGQRWALSRSIAPGDSELHPLQQAFWDEYGFQCGYCLPGMLFSALDLLEQNPSPSEAEIRHAISGNYCRCTGYNNIVKSIQTAAERIAAAK